MANSSVPGLELEVSAVFLSQPTSFPLGLCGQPSASRYQLASNFTCEKSRLQAQLLPHQQGSAVVLGVALDPSPGLWERPGAGPCSSPSSVPAQFPGWAVPAHKLVAAVLVDEVQLEAD